jgi:hypothetical protein
MQIVSEDSVHGCKKEISEIQNGDEEEDRHPQEHQEGSLPQGTCQKEGRPEEKGHREKGRPEEKGHREKGRPEEKGHREKGRPEEKGRSNAGHAS